MKNEELKKALISEIENCENTDLLMESLLLLIGPPPSKHNYSEVKEVGPEYKTEWVSPVPQEHWDLLKEQMDEYLKGNIKAISWEDLKKELFEGL